VCQAIIVNTPTKIDFELPEEFKWPAPDKPDKEIDKENTCVPEYLKKIVAVFNKLQVKKSMESNLIAIVSVVPHHLNGAADIYVLPSAVI
jgi:hypothetical protein